MSTVTTSRPKRSATNATNNRIMPLCGRHAPITGIGDDTYHVHCPGSSVNGDKSVVYCGCDCHVRVTVCRDCRRHGIEIIDGICIDPDECAGHVIERQNHNPAWVMLKAVKAESLLKTAEANSRRVIEREAQRAREARETGVDGETTPRPPKIRREPKAPAVPQNCHCGCGAITKGGKFAAGHDAKLKGWLVKGARMHREDDAGVRPTKADAIHAMAELIARNWPRKNVDTKITEQADALVEQHGYERIIELAVGRRYGGSKW